MLTLFDSARVVHSNSFALGIAASLGPLAYVEPADDGSVTPTVAGSFYRPYTHADAMEWARWSNAFADERLFVLGDDDEFRPDEDWDRLAELSAALDRLERGLLGDGPDQSGAFLGHPA
jgi:hypothetical protein